MAKPLSLHFRNDDPGNLFAAVIGRYADYLDTARYGSKRRRYVASVVHFAHWLSRAGLTPINVDEALIKTFLSEHLPQCSCPRPLPLRLIEVRAALNLMLRVMHTQGIAPVPGADDIELELACFDSKMVGVWGLSQGTRDHRCRIIRRFLRAQFGAGPIMLASIKVSAVRCFVLGEPGRSARTIRVMGGTIRCWLRYRELMGEKIVDLQHAVPRPACWQQTLLPEALSENELLELFASFDMPCPSRRRGYAMVRCLADLGLRCSEVASLHLGHIDWQAGTIHVAAGKGRRADVLPLPAATGAAIADYLLHERPRAIELALKPSSAKRFHMARLASTKTTLGRHP